MELNIPSGTLNKTTPMFHMMGVSNPLSNQTVWECVTQAKWLVRADEKHKITRTHI